MKAEHEGKEDNMAHGTRLKAHFVLPLALYLEP